MSPELDKALCETFPKIFANRDGPMSTTNMCRGFEVQDGWYPLIDVLCEQLQRGINRQGEPQVVASQVKEKFGGLRFYVDSASDCQQTMISFAEALSYRICEECGSPGTLDDRNRRLLSTRCSNHRKA